MPSLRERWNNAVRAREDESARAARAAQQNPVAAAHELQRVMDEGLAPAEARTSRSRTYHVMRPHRRLKASISVLALEQCQARWWAFWGTVVILVLAFRSYKLREMRAERSAGPNELKPNGKKSDAPTETKKPEPSKPVATPSHDENVHRVLWERTRRSRAVEAFLVQGYLWSNLFAFKRGSFTGARVIIPFVIALALAIYVLVSVSRFGNGFDIAMMLFSAFSSIIAAFAILYWNYGASGNFTENLTQLDAIYFSVGTLTTAGTGNISAVSQAARGLQTVQMVLDIGFIVVAVSLVVAEIHSRMQR